MFVTTYSSTDTAPMSAVCKVDFDLQGVLSVSTCSTLLEPPGVWVCLCVCVCVCVCMCVCMCACVWVCLWVCVCHGQVTCVLG